MASIFNALNTGYSGLKTSQVAIDTIGHNIANAENPDYTRQRVVIEPNTPLNTTPGDIGLGAKITEIVRIHDEFVYKRLKSSSSDSEYANFRQSTLDEVSTYFPEIDKNGIYDSLAKYFDAWNSFSTNSDDSALKIDLAQQSKSLAVAIKDTRQLLQDTQDSLDEQLKTSIDEINRLGKEIAELNVRIDTHEAGGDNANDLRDQRDKLELALSKLVNIEVSKGELKSDMSVDPNYVESTDQYHLSIGGSSFVDGSTFHPLVLENAGDGTPYSNVYYQRQDYVKFDITNYLQGGKVGAILSLRGSDYSEEYGKFMNGDIQGIIDKLDSFASALITNTNNIYASHATDSMFSNVSVDSNMLISNSTLPIDTAQQFKVKVYDSNGAVVAERSIGLEGTFQDVVDDINRSDIDDNGDNTITNDVDDFVSASIDPQGNFSISLKAGMEDQGYRFSIEEVDPQNPSLFAGALGLERFFDGTNAEDIDLNRYLDENPTRIGGNGAPIAGDNSVANAMVQLQYDKIDFYIAGSQEPYSSDTLSGFFRMSTTEVAEKTAAAHTTAETSQSLLNAVVNEFDSISRVDIDEELTNLMKYQTGYSASAKVITTIDQMIETLLGIKQ
ncbi:MAG: flagellar hook-associated protein FlgK [Hydrogenimonas sp.]|nr:flagellar hook-associated protein FlgK [Hydrogenimonas sp.]